MSDFWNDSPNREPENKGSQQNNTPSYYTPSQPDHFQQGSQQPQWNYSQYTTQPPKRPKRNRGLVVFLVLLCSVLLIAVLCLAGVGVYSLVTGDGFHFGVVEEPAPPPAEVSPEDATPELPTNPDLQLELQDKPQGDGITVSEDGRLTTTEVYHRVAPVTVSVIQYSPYQGQMTSGSGTGIIMSEDGYIVTNAHVVTTNGTAASSLEVILDNGNRYEATLVGADTRSDLAVLKIEATDLPYATFGDSDQMEIGETVIAIGNPGGTELTSSVSQGIISGLNRLIKTSSDGYSINCLQTDAAINPGNSGGPLVNQFGQVIGINSAKLVDTQYEGIGFAIPINEAKPIIDQLIAYGRVTDRARIGITGVAITPSFSQYYGWPQGILIITTEEGADISTKGLRAGEVGGDIITHINDQAIASFDDVAQILKDKKGGEQVKLTVYRQAFEGQPSSTFDVNIILVSDSN